MKTPRDYQLEAIDGNTAYPGIFAALERRRAAICVMATGLGKTTVGAIVCNRWCNGGVLWLAHRIELLDQAANDLERELGYRPPIEQGPRGLDPSTMFEYGNVIVGSIQSMITDRRRRKFADTPFGLIVVDECHRSTSPSYKKLLDQYPNAKILGLTATANRTDGTAMGLVYEVVAYEMGIVEGIDKGWLCDIQQKFAVCEDLDLSKIPLTTNEFGERDFQAAALQELLNQEGPLHAMSRPVLDMTTHGQQAIVFTASVQHAHLWAAVLNHYRPDCAKAIDGTMGTGPDTPRAHAVSAYRRGELQFLLNYGVATEGFDAPMTAMVVMGRPTKSKLVYTQMLGRCTRALPGIVDAYPTPDERKDAIKASTKPFAIVLDFVGATKLGVCTASDILGGNYDVDVRDAADNIIGAKGQGNVRDALNKARASLLLESEEQKRRPIRDAVAKMKITYHVGNAGSIGTNGTQNGRKVKTSRGGATDGQVAALVNLGVDKATAQGYSRKQAGAVTKDLMAKRCTERQAKTLRKFGFDPKQFNTAKAHKQIQAIADNGWKWP